VLRSRAFRGEVASWAASRQTPWARLCRRGSSAMTPYLYDPGAIGLPSGGSNRRRAISRAAPHPGAGQGLSGPRDRQAVVQAPGPNPCPVRPRHAERIDEPVIGAAPWWRVVDPFLQGRHVVRLDRGENQVTRSRRHRGTSSCGSLLHGVRVRRSPFRLKKYGSARREDVEENTLRRFFAQGRARPTPQSAGPVARGHGRDPPPPHQKGDHRDLAPQSGTSHH